MGAARNCLAATGLLRAAACDTWLEPHVGRVFGAFWARAGAGRLENESRPGNICRPTRTLKITA
eukprot:5989285-Lingulodinium_polyedra.AAC.1